MSGFRVLAAASLVLSCGAAGAAQQTPPRVEPTHSVTLSLAEYNRLIDLADRPPQSESEEPPNPVVVSTADLDIRVDDGVARGVFTLAGQVFRSGLTAVTLADSTTLIAATSSGNAVPFVTGNGIHALIDRGPFSLAVGWGAPLAVGAGRATFGLPVPKAGAVRATINLPGDQADVQITPGTITGRTVANGRTVVDVTLDPGSATSVAWSMRDSVQSAPVREMRASAEVLTLVTLGDSDIRMVALVDVTVLQGELRTVTVQLPRGFELTSVTGNSIASSTPREDGVQLSLGEPAARSHQFLVTLERPHAGGSFGLETAVIALPDLQRTRGEIAVEGVGTLELDSKTPAGLHRIDVRELGPSLQSLAAWPLLAGFRYQQNGPDPPSVALDVTRFADAGVLAAVADEAAATTLVTGEGRALTEVRLRVQNRAQPFLKVQLPAGASMVSVDVAGQSAKPVAGTDGTRVPLLRPGFRPSGPYDVSFVYLHAGAPFARKGDLVMALPRMDVPVGIVRWEVFVPDRYSAQAVGGNAIDLRRFSMPAPASALVRGADVARTGSGVAGIAADAAARVPLAAPRDTASVSISLAATAAPGQIAGRALDASGHPLSGATVSLTAGNQRKDVVTGSEGRFVFRDVATGAVTLSARLPGFREETTSMAFDGRARDVSFQLRPAGVRESVMAESLKVETRTDINSTIQPSVPQSVIALQQRTSGVLPIRIDVPRAGTLHNFVKPLVIDQETTVTLRYKRR